ncbi:aminotransferase class I/II-fold pyridoxal phosphate-dependent enzyme [Dermatobacter hominis]|uniref:aminotransferase class I/II-fold pyridoxal phosphate-dependent enzyme n=1 Tax=Dermatobacter hominis TaxID=2884263 RepID=UPI001D0FC2E1|nr:aminotransferase class I/II-fold pyridoxal phosphate-dependent enzyme [Dermatobacter hominis]UDY36814.1 aminotransferase class I/II-fold pyridoxal phosphate-dependent enzyme [Dermatobacter hominis]
MTQATAGFVPPPYPYDRLREVEALAAERFGAAGGVVDLSIGTPHDPPPRAVLEALAGSDTERGYPPSIGTPALRDAVSGWFARRFAVDVDPSAVGACVGTKELVAGLPHWLRLRDPSRDTVLYPAVSYPSYAMGATLAGCRAVPVPVDDRWRLDLSAVDPDDAARALCLWCNTPGNPAGALDDLDAAAEWGRTNGVLVLSDECYVEFTWAGTPVVAGQQPGHTILEAGAPGVVAVHSLSKRSNLAGLRVGFYAGDADVVGYLQEVRKHAGLMVPGPAQAAGVAALADQLAVDEQRLRYRTRLERMAGILARTGVAAPLPEGGFYLWVPAPEGDAWGLARRLATDLGVVASPGEFYGDAAADHVRLAMVQPDAALDLLEARVGPLSA